MRGVSFRCGGGVVGYKGQDSVDLECFWWEGNFLYESKMYAYKDENESF